jgi:excisionase family DNA binding protein
MTTTPLTETENPSPADLLTAEEVATILRVSPGWVYEQARRNRLPHLRLGRYVRIRRGALDDWITCGETEPPR